MSKTVREQTFKFYPSHFHAFIDREFTLKEIEYEGDAPETLEILSEKYRLKSFTRYSSLDKFVEQVYIKVE